MTYALRLRALFSVRARLALLFFVLIVALLAMAQLFIQHVDDSRAVEADAQRAQEHIRASGAVQTAILEYRIFLLRATLFAANMPELDLREQLEKVAQADTQMRKRLAEFNALYPAEKLTLSNPVPSPVQYAERIAELAHQGHSQEFMANLRQTNQAFNALHQRLGQIIERSRAEQAEVFRRTEALHHGKLQRAALIMAATLLTAILLTGFTLRRVIASLQRTMQRLHAIPVSGSSPHRSRAGDEFDQINHALERLRESTLALDQLAYVHPLTGLPNNLRLTRDLEETLLQAQRMHTGVGLLFVDLNGFRAINDAIGHDIGDACLIAIGERLRALLTPRDAVYHFGGDLFALYFEASLDELEPLAKTLASRVHEAIVEPIILSGRSLRLSASIGVALYPDHADDARTMVATADVAVHQAWKMGRRTTQFADRELAGRASHNLLLAEDIQRGMDAHEFVPYYEPVVDIENDRVAVAEALLRWRHPTHGVLTPSRFLAVAEHTGLMYPMTATAFQDACETFARWPEGPHLAFNISPRQISSELPTLLRNVLQRTGMPAQRLELEIVESTLMERIDEVARVLAEVRDMGIRISLDDFGTGYSSLSYLQRLPVSKLKIDRSFISRIDTSRASHTIVSSMISIAHHLNIEIVAEGVENRRQLEILRTLGCRYVQGQLFSLAMPDTALREWSATPPLSRLAAPR